MTTKKTAKSGDKAAATKLPVKKISGTPAPKQNAKQPKKEHKVKVVRDSFTMPDSEYQSISAIKEICLQAGMHVKKSEVLRAGLKLLAKLSNVQLKRAMHDLEKIKTGRPRNH